MTEQEFDKHIAAIEGGLKQISSNSHSPLRKSFVSGVLSGLGGIFGVAIALAAIRWVLIRPG